MNPIQPKTIYLIRHGETDYNRQGIIQGGTIDSSLNDKGYRQAEAFWERYGNTGFEVVLTSRLQRTHQTVRRFLESGIRWEQFADINEMNWGTREGQYSTPQIMAEYEEIKARWSQGWYETRAHDGENALELFQRVKRFVDHLGEREENTILVCSHGRAMCAMITAFRNEPLSEMNKYRHENTGLWVIRLEGSGFTIEKENSTEHLLEARIIS